LQVSTNNFKIIYGLFLSQDIKIKINKTKKLGLEAQTQWFGLQTAQQLVFIFLLELDLTSIVWVELKYIQSYFFNTSTTQ
jgi:hypothetical protein